MVQLKVYASQLTDLIEKKIPEFLTQGEEHFTAATIVSTFKAKLEDMRSVYFKDIRRIRTASENDILVEQANKERAEHVKKLFEAKKDKLMAKTKARQSMFFSGTAHSAKTMVKKITQTVEQEVVLCAVSREPLGDAKTFYQFADYHRSNVIVS